MEAEGKVKQRTVSPHPYLYLSLYYLPGTGQLIVGEWKP